MSFCSILIRHPSFSAVLALLLVQSLYFLAPLTWAGDVENFDVKSADNNLQVIIQTDKRAPYSVEHSPKGMSVLLNETSLPAGTPRTKTFTLSNGKRVQGTLSNTASGQVRLHIPEVTAKDFAVSVVQKTTPKTAASPAREEVSQSANTPVVASPTPRPRTSAFQQTGGQNEADLLDAIVKRFQGETPHTQASSPSTASKPVGKPASKMSSTPSFKSLSKPVVKTTPQPVAASVAQPLEVSTPTVKASANKVVKTSSAQSKPSGDSTLAKKMVTKPSSVPEPVAALALGGPEIPTASKKTSRTPFTEKSSKVSTASSGDLSKAALFSAGSAAVASAQQKQVPQVSQESEVSSSIGPEAPVHESNQPESSLETLSKELDAANPKFNEDSSGSTSLENTPLTVVETGRSATESQPSFWDDWLHWNAMMLSDLPSWAIGLMGVCLLFLGLAGGLIAIRTLLRQLNQQMDADSKVLPLDLLPAYPGMNTTNAAQQSPVIDYTSTQVHAHPQQRVPSNNVSDEDLDFGLNAVQSSFSSQSKTFQDRARVNASQYLMGNHQDMRQAVRTTMKLKYATKPSSLFK